MKLCLKKTTATKLLLVGSMLLASTAIGCSAETEDDDVGGAPDEEVASSTSEALTSHCGTFTCSLYLSRSQTRRAVTPAGLVGALGSLSRTPIGLAIGAAAWAINVKASEAAGKNQCLRIRYTRHPVVATLGYYSDGSGYCRN